jgi:hypothetical protein
MRLTQHNFLEFCDAQTNKIIKIKKSRENGVTETSNRNIPATAKNL